MPTGSLPGAMPAVPAPEGFAGMPARPNVPGPEGFAGMPARPNVPGRESFTAGMASPGTEPETPFDDQMEKFAAWNVEGGALNGRRSFTVMSSTAKGASGGTYLSTAPLNAAKKAARQLFAKSATRTNKIKFVLRETTRGSKKKTYKYVATKKKLSPPKTVMRGNVKIVLKHEYEVKADN